MPDVHAFIDRWKASGASERSNYALFISELCDVLGVERPEPATDRRAQNAYVIDRAVTLHPGPNASTGFADCYKKGCFVLEAKQGSDAPVPTEHEQLTGQKLKRKMGEARRGTRSWEMAMQRAKGQARRYARALPAADGWPPFLLVVDVGHCIDLYADFARQGKTYLQFPDPQHYRIQLEDLESEAVREQLRLLWTDPMALDPARRSARVTRALAEQLGRLAASLEQDGHDPDRTAQFLMRSLFTMFAEDVGLLPERSFTGLLEDYRAHLGALPDQLEHLWQTMNTGGFAPALKARLRAFNGHLFADAEALPVSAAQLDLLTRAAQADWSDVEPAIFGTLLERALDPKERHRLGAHYTPRAYVERLVQPTIIEPLRTEWEAAQTAAASLEAEGDTDKAAEEIRAFHRRLCTVKVLDPACGSGNFLYVTLEHLKRLEAEVLQSLESYGVGAGLDMTGGLRVSPEQLLGLELNPRAARIADVVLWIGYLQWHFRTYGSADRLDAPILKKYGNIRQQDALLTYDAKSPRTDAGGAPVTRWDRATFKEHPTTGEMVPDESAQIPVYDYLNPEMADWPEADFIVGNPPFIGNKRMREALGDGYTEALREAYYRRVPQSADFVMFWWYKAANAVRKGEAERFGFVTTNSIRQTFNRKIVDKQITSSPPLTLAFAIPDHPWITSKEGADVRIAMTVGAVTDQPGTLQTVSREGASDSLHNAVELAEKRGTILPDLTIGPDVAGTEKLAANDGISYRGFNPVGRGFVIEPKKARELGLGKIRGLEQHIRPYRNGRDIAQHSRGLMIIDLYGLSTNEVRDRFPAVYQHVLENVKPERDQNRRKSRRENWWIFGEPNPSLRDALDGLERFIVTPYVSKHSFFQFLDTLILPDDMLVNIALDDAYYLGVLSSRIHVTWSLAAGGNVGVGNDPRYTNTRCFDPFPFPAASEAQREVIRRLAEALDAHRKRQLGAFDGLTMTGLYNVLEKERAGLALSAEERQVHEQGLVALLRELHDELDAAVAKTYGWPAGLGEEEILERLVALNKERRAEEQQGTVRYLRPAYQAPEAAQAKLEMEVDVATGGDGAALEPQPWPKALAERAQAVRQVVSASAAPLTVEQVARRFHRARRKQVRSLLETLDALGQVRRSEDGGYAA